MDSYKQFYESSKVYSITSPLELHLPAGWSEGREAVRPLWPLLHQAVNTGPRRLESPRPWTDQSNCFKNEWAAKAGSPGLFLESRGWTLKTPRYISIGLHGILKSRKFYMKNPDIRLFLKIGRSGDPGLYPWSSHGCCWNLSLSLCLAPLSLSYISCLDQFLLYRATGRNGPVLETLGKEAVQWGLLQAGRRSLCQGGENETNSEGNRSKKGKEWTWDTGGKTE